MSDHNAASAAGGAVLTIDEGCHICSFNEEAERITGLRAEDVLGRRFCEALWSMPCRVEPDRTTCQWRYAIQGWDRRTGMRAWQVNIGEKKRLQLLVGEQGYTTPEGARGAIITLREEPPAVLL